MYVCMYVCMYVRMYVCKPMMCAYMHTEICTCKNTYGTKKAQ